MDTIITSNQGKKVFAICFLSVLLLCACGNKNEKSIDNIYTGFSEKYSGAVYNQEGFEGQSYYDMGILKDSQNLHNTTLYLDKNESLSCFLYLNNHIGSQYNFTIAIFDNYEQINFIVDGEEMKECTVSVKNGKDIDIPITISNLNDGKHDLMFAIFVDTYRDLSEEERVFAGNRDNQLRCNVIVNDKSDFTSEFVSLQEEKIKARTNGVVLNRIDGDDYSIEVGNLDLDTEYCAIILLDNFEQIDLTQDTGYGYIVLNPGEEIVLPIDDYIKLDDENSHEISVICVRNAGQNGENFQGLVFFSNRILITKN